MKGIPCPPTHTRFPGRSRVGRWLYFALVLLVHAGAPAWAQLSTLRDVDFSTSADGDLTFRFSFDSPIATPRMFMTENPTRLAIDFPGARNGLKQTLIPVRSHGAESLQAIEAGGRTRVILNLASMVPYAGEVEGNGFRLTLKTGDQSHGAYRRAPNPPLAPSRQISPGYAAPAAMRDPIGVSRVNRIDFRRGDRGEGRVIITLSDRDAAVNVRPEGGRIVVTLPGSTIPSQVARQYDVTDFATPVRSIDASSGTKVVITPGTADYDYSSYQTDTVLTVELRPLSRAEREEVSKKRGIKYSGERLSLNFQDIPVRSVLQILADFTNLNIVASDSVQGNVTLRLNEVPWDQALDLVLKSKGLAKRQDGNIIRVAPTDEINRLEKEDLEAQRIVEDLEPLRTEIIQIKYTRADEIKKVLMGTIDQTTPMRSDPTTLKDLRNLNEPPEGPATAEVTQSILSGRGNVTVDPRTNQLIVKDTARNLERIRDLINQLDKSVRQVLIESRIVIARNDFFRELGAKIGLNRVVPGALQTQRAYLVPTEGVLPVDATQGATYGSALVDLAAKGGSFVTPAAAGFTLLKAGDYLLDLELSAAQRVGRSELLSNPRVITGDQTKATIKQGVEIPVQITQQGTTGGLPVQNVQFKEVVLELNVTPHITPDDFVLMDLLIKKDTPGGTTTNGNIIIEKREIQTTAQVANGETVVLGGIYETDNINTVDKVPFFGDLPGIGFFFRRDEVQDNKRELLIFITPKLLNDSLGAAR
ncbi:type IV pilus secretin PilQ [Methylotetracoccus oryzae]|uniref:type IV pilus secretin PilQ n=1 Tax=Methylotetracoccus oryzae TaxID=1919059 RepID=UPI001117C0AE|nr:type IV pilus secretin PilQ [Methylotetracoccus oryzae]